MKKFNWFGAQVRSRLLLAASLFFLVLMNPNAEAILQAADKAGLALAAVVMLCLIAIHGAVFHVAYGWYANRYYQKKYL